MRAILLAAGLCVLGGCTSVPPLEHATRGIPLHDIVIRVKCELADSFSDRLSSPYFAWMSRWTVKVDLTLLANNQAAVVPSVNYTDFLKNATNPITGSNVAQFFNFGISANLSETATRTELISFTLSLRELAAWKKDERNYGELCDPGRKRELTGNLGLTEWLNSALAPVTGPKADLYAGDHPTPASGKGGERRGGSALDIKEKYADVTGYITAVDKVKTVVDLAATTFREQRAVKVSILRANPSYLAARKRFKDYRAKWYSVLSPQDKRTIHEWDETYEPSGLITQTVKELQRASQAMARLRQQLDIIDKNDEKVPLDAEAQGLKAYLLYEAYVWKKKDDLDKWMNIERSNWDNVKFDKEPDPPIDSISHSVQFVVAYGAGVSPVWTLLQWKGPAGSSPLLSAGGGRTHTLNMTLGSSATEQSRALQTLAIQQILLLPR